MSFMRKDNHVDPEVFALLLESGLYADYAETHLTAEQRDDVDIAAFLRR